MSLFKKIEKLKAQIVDTKRLLEMVIDHPLMADGISEKLNNLKKELESLPKSVIDPRVKLLFSGNAVVGSQGIKTSFISKTLKPFQEMVKTQAALVRFGKVGQRGQTKKGPNTDLYLTALPVGSFGVELSQLETDQLFDGEEISDAMKQVIHLVNRTSLDDETFETAIENTPKRNLSNLKKFLKEVYEEKSLLKMECGEIGIEIPEDKIIEAYTRVSKTIDEQNEKFVSGIFRGILLDSGKFEMQDNERNKISGFISQELSEEELVNYDKEYLNKQCKFHLQIHKTIFKTGKERIDYELLGITEE